MDLDLAKMDELVFGGRASSQGRPARAEVEVTVVRGLTAQDIPALEHGHQLVPTPKPSGPSALKHAHHQVARLLAEGRELVEISLITGYTPEYIGLLKHGGDFQELMRYYDTQRQMVFVDTLERMKTLGITSLERLQVLLEDDSSAWTKRELMEMAELMLIKPGQQRGGLTAPGSNAPGVVVNVKFVSAGVPEGSMLNITPDDG